MLDVVIMYVVKLINYTIVIVLKRFHGVHTHTPCLFMVVAIFLLTDLYILRGLKHFMFILGAVPISRRNPKIQSSVKSSID